MPRYARTPRARSASAWGALRALLSVASLALLASSAACGNAARAQTCGEIPEGGCPLGRGGTCDDQLCAALYDCVDGSWTEAEDCGRVLGSGGAGAGGGGGEGGACQAVEIDRTGERFGCTPGLLEPDCPVAAAELCDPCSTGCVDFWMCTDEGWESVAYCDESGAFILDGAGG